MKEIKNKRGVVALTRVILFILFSGMLMISASSSYADNLSLNSTLPSEISLTNSTLTANTTEDANLTQNVTSNASDTSLNISETAGINISEHNTTLDFEMILERAEFVNDTHINFIGSINISEVVTDYGINYSEPYFAQINVSIYADLLNDTYPYHCTFEVNGTSEFGCIAINATEYVVIASVLFDNETFYRYATFTNEEMYAELIKEDEPENKYIFDDNLKMYVEFEEVYTGGTVYGDVISNAENGSKLVVEVWPVNATNSMYEKGEICEFTVFARDSFNCSLSFMDTGTYEINVTIISGNESYSLREITYYVAPEYLIRVVHEGVYKVGDVVTISGYATLANTRIDESMSIIVVDGPGNVTYKTEGVNPELEFIADVPGEYEIDYYSYFRGINYSRTSKIVVAEPERFGRPRERKLELLLDDIYSEDSIVEISAIMKNMNITENESARFVIVEDATNSTIEMKTRIRGDIAEVPYLIPSTGNFTIKVDVDSQNMSSLRTITAINSEVYAYDIVLRPLIESVMSKNISREIRVAPQNIVYDRISSSYNLTIELDAASSARLFGVRDINRISNISYVETNDTRVMTDVFAMDDVDVDFAEISLRRSSTDNVEAILHCKDWNYTSSECVNWERTRIPFVQNSTHIIFNVSSFSAYAGGEGFNSQLLVWDSTDEDFENETAYITELVYFFANYSSYPNNESIEGAVCEIEIEGTNRTMAYNSTSGLYWYNTTFSDRGDYNYSVYCDESSYDELDVENEIDVFSKADISQISLTRNSITLGYAIALSCEVLDHYNSEELFGYNVSFYSSIEGYIGSQTTDVMGWSSVAFRPESVGEHEITCEIEDDIEDFYIANLNSESDSLDVELSRFRVEKNVTHNSSDNQDRYDVVLEVMNYGESSIFDVSVADFIPDSFTPDFDIAPDEQHITTINGVEGTVYVWEIEQINSLDVVKITYRKTPTDPNVIYKVSDSYIIGGTYEIN